MSFGCHRFDQKTNEIFFKRISARASKKKLNQNLYHTNYVKQPLILDATRTEILKEIPYFFGQNDGTKKAFRN